MTQQQLNQLGQQIRQARIDRGQSQADLAAQSDVGMQTLIRIEQGNPGVAWGKVQQVLEQLGMSLRCG